MLMFGSYSVINVIVLLNLLIAMMSNSYNMIKVSSFRFPAASMGVFSSSSPSRASRVVSYAVVVATREREGRQEGYTSRPPSCSTLSYPLPPYSLVRISSTLIDPVPSSLLYSLFETSQSLFWASFGLVELDAFELTGVGSFTRFWAMLMFGSYSVINIIVLLNLLIAMMSNSYNVISVGHSFIHVSKSRALDYYFFFSLSLLLSFVDKTLRIRNKLHVTAESSLFFFLAAF